MTNGVCSYECKPLIREWWGRINRQQMKINIKMPNWRTISITTPASMLFVAMCNVIDAPCRRLQSSRSICLDFRTHRNTQMNRIREWAHGACTKEKKTQQQYGIRIINRQQYTVGARQAAYLELRCSSEANLPTRSVWWNCTRYRWTSAAIPAPLIGRSDQCHGHHWSPTFRNRCRQWTMRIGMLLLVTQPASARDQSCCQRPTTPLAPPHSCIQTQTNKQINVPFTNSLSIDASTYLSSSCDHVFTSLKLL